MTDCRGINAMPALLAPVAGGGPFSVGGTQRWSDADSFAVAKMSLAADSVSRCDYGTAYGAANGRRECLPRFCSGSGNRTVNLASDITRLYFPGNVGRNFSDRES